MTGAAMAQDDGPNSFGLYFDDVGDGCYMMNGTPADFAATVAARMVLAGPVEGPIGGFEVAFDAPPGVLSWLGTTFPVDGIDVAPDPNAVIVGFAAPVEPNACGHVYLGDLSFLVLNVDGFEILAGPTTPASIPGEVAFLVFGTSTIIPMEFSTDADGMGRDDQGWTLPGYGLCAVNTDAAIPTEDASWTDVKGLFR
jgi:hypothetical protein